MGRLRCLLDQEHFSGLPGSWPLLGGTCGWLLCARIRLLGLPHEGIVDRMLVQVVCAVRCHVFIVHLDIHKDQELMAKRAHLVDRLCVSPEPSECLLGDACVETAQPSLDSRHILRATLALFGVLRAVPCVNCPVLDLA